MNNILLDSCKSLNDKSVNVSVCDRGRLFLILSFKSVSPHFRLMLNGI